MAGKMQHSPPPERKEVEERGSIFCGIGSPKPKSRVLNANLFGHVPDAFDDKSLKIGEEAPSDKRKRLAKEAEEKRLAEEEAAAEEARKKEEEEKAAAENGTEEPEVEEETAAPLPVSEAVGGFEMKILIS